MHLFWLKTPTIFAGERKIALKKFRGDWESAVGGKEKGGKLHDKRGKSP